MTKNICSSFTLVDKNGKEITNYCVEEWDGTSHAERNQLDQNLHQIMWAGYNQEDYQTVLTDGYINIERGIFEWTPGIETPWSILWLKDTTDIEATKKALLEKVGFEDSSKVNWRVNLLDHRITTEDPTFYAWWYIDNDGITHTENDRPSVPSVATEVNTVTTEELTSK